MVSCHHLRTRLFDLCCWALLIPSAALAQPDRATTTEIVVAALRAVRFDSLCGRGCRVIAVDTEIRGAQSPGQGPDYVPVVDWAYARALRALSVPSRRFVPGAYPINAPSRKGDSASVWMSFTPPALTMADSGVVYVGIDVPYNPGMGFDAHVIVKKHAGKWRVVRIWYWEA